MRCLRVQGEVLVHAAELVGDARCQAQNIGLRLSISISHYITRPHLLIEHAFPISKMAGGLVKYRHLSRHSAHRKALLRNLVQSLIEHESISTTWHKAKEAQRLAEKLITLAKKNTPASQTRAQAIFFVSPLTCAGLDTRESAFADFE